MDKLDEAREATNRLIADSLAGQIRNSALAFAVDFHKGTLTSLSSTANRDEVVITASKFAEFLSGTDFEPTPSKEK